MTGGCDIVPVDSATPVVTLRIDVTPSAGPALSAVRVVRSPVERDLLAAVGARVGVILPTQAEDQAEPAPSSPCMRAIAGVRCPLRRVCAFSDGRGGATGRVGHRDLRVDRPVRELLGLALTGTNRRRLEPAGRRRCGRAAAPSGRHVVPPTACVRVGVTRAVVYEIRTNAMY